MYLFYSVLPDLYTFYFYGCYFELFYGLVLYLDFERESRQIFRCPFMHLLRILNVFNLNFNDNDKEEAEAEDILDTQRPVNREIHIRAEAEAEEARRLHSGTVRDNCLKTAVQEAAHGTVRDNCLKTAVQEAAQWDREGQLSEDGSAGGCTVGQGGTAV